MVDTDKIRDRMEKGKEKNKSGSSKKRRRKKKGGGGGKSSSSSGSTDVPDVREKDLGERRGEKMDKLRKAKGLDAKESTDKPVPRRVSGKALECMANILLYTEGKMRSYKDPDTPRKVVETNVTTSVYEQFTEIIAQGNVQAICEKYGVDWQEDVIKSVVTEQNFDGDVDNIGSMDHGVVSMGNGRKFQNEDYWQLLIVLGQMQLFARLVRKKIDEQNDPQNKMAEKALEDINAKIIDFLGVFSVPDTAIEYGIDWDDDVLDNVSSQTSM